MLRDVAWLAGLQIGIAGVAAGLVAVLQFEAGSGSWIGALGMLVGAQAFVAVKEKRQPGAFTVPYRRRMAAAAVAVQVVLAALFFGVLLVLDPSVAELLQGAEIWLLAGCAIALPLVYGVTRLGFRMGLKYAKPRT